jgi:threonylcarbamoyladenosine tRNA methylthiotransferase MtaB
MVGREEVLLVEKDGLARAGNFAPARMESPARPGALVRAAITGHDGTHLTALALEAV